MSAHRRMPRPATLAGLLLLVVLALAACDRGGASPEPTPPTAGPGTPPPTVAAPISVELAPGGAPVVLDNGWTVAHCEGDAPFLCVSDGDRHVGTVEYAAYPPSGELVAAIGEDEVLEALTAHVADQHEAIRADRAVGCGSDYDYRAEPIDRTTVGGEAAVVYAFSGVVDGREVERHRAYLTFHAGRLWILTAAASTPDGCMASDLPEFTPADLAAFAPYLDRIVAGSQLPAAG